MKRESFQFLNKDTGESELGFWFANKKGKELDRLFFESIKKWRPSIGSDAVSEEWSKIILSGILASYLTSKIENYLEDCFQNEFE